MEKGQGKRTDTLHRDNDYLRRGDVKRLLENVVCLHEELPAQIDLIPAADVVARDCFDKILAGNDDMRAIIDTYGGLNNIQSAFVKLHEIETADVVPVRHGWWISEPGHIPHCSECGRYSDDADTGEAICCPFCGAKMDKDGDGE